MIIQVIIVVIFPYWDLAGEVKITPRVFTANVALIIPGMQKISFYISTKFENRFFGFILGKHRCADQYKTDNLKSNFHGLYNLKLLYS